MPGAIIPDDWDGSTYECLQIQWPASPLWRALLLGQASEPGIPTYWDPATGDVDQAATAASKAYGQTISQEQLDCGDPLIEQILPPTNFVAVKTSDQVLTPQVWQQVTWETHLEFTTNGFIVTGLNAHIPGASNKEGVWQYEVLIACTLPANFYIQIKSSVRAALAVSRVIGQQSNTVSYITNVPAPSEQITIEIFPTGQASVFASNWYTYFSGHYLGVAE